MGVRPRGIFLKKNTGKRLIHIVLKSVNHLSVQIALFIFITLMPTIADARCVHPLLCGSDEGVRRQNQIADAQGLKIFTERDLEEAKQNGTLVPLPENEDIVIDARLDPALRWCSPAMRDFLLEKSKGSFKCFGYPWQINSAVRTIERQEYLRMCKRVCRRGKCRRIGGCNQNAGSTHGPKTSLHLRGVAVDIAKKPMRNGKKVDYGRNGYCGRRWN